MHVYIVASSTGSPGYRVRQLSCPLHRTTPRVAFIERTPNKTEARHT